MASQITGVSIVYSTICSGTDKRKHHSSASLAFMRGIQVTGEFPAQRASNAENVSIWWRHHARIKTLSASWHIAYIMASYGMVMQKACESTSIVFSLDIPVWVAKCVSAIESSWIRDHTATHEAVRSWYLLAFTLMPVLSTPSPYKMISIRQCQK